MIVIAVVGFLLAGRNNSADTDQINSSVDTNDETSSGSGSDVKSAATVVTYTDNGFSPASVTIKDGDSVTFKNESNNDMWVASNPHPVHTELAGFDARKNMSKGESYTFTFTKSGTWGYHNHPNSSDAGTVVVE